MIRSYFFRGISLTLAFVLFIASSGLTMDMHYCEGKLKRINLFGKAKSCAEMAECAKKCGKQIKSCSKNGDHSGCCHNNSLLLDLDTEKTIDVGIQTQGSKDLIKVVYSSLFIKNSIRNFNSATEIITHPPPLLERDIFLFTDSFLL